MSNLNCFLTLFRRKLIEQIPLLNVAYFKNCSTTSIKNGIAFWQKFSKQKIESVTLKTKMYIMLGRTIVFLTEWSFLLSIKHSYFPTRSWFSTKWQNSITLYHFRWNIKRKIKHPWKEYMYCKVFPKVCHNVVTSDTWGRGRFETNSKNGPSIHTFFMRADQRKKPADLNTGDKYSYYTTSLSFRYEAGKK